jgi:hypothetical protein
MRRQEFIKLISGAAVPFRSWDMPTMLLSGNTPKGAGLGV